MPKKREKPQTPKEEIAVTIRFPIDLHQQATQAAAADDRSFNLFVVRAVREALGEGK